MKSVSFQKLKKKKKVLFWGDTDGWRTKNACCSSQYPTSGGLQPQLLQFQGCDTCFWLPQVPALTCTYPYTNRHIHGIKTKYILN